MAQLCDVLRNAGAVDANRPVLPDPDPGKRGAGDSIADVVATLEPTVGLVGKIVSALRGWLANSRRPQRTIELTAGEHSLKISGLSSANEDRLVAAFIRVLEGK